VTNEGNTDIEYYTAGVGSTQLGIKGTRLLTMLVFSIYFLATNYTSWPPRCTPIYTAWLA